MRAMSSLCIVFCFSFFVYCYSIHCPIISAITMKQLEEKENCTSTNLIHIENATNITDLNSLKNLVKIHYIPNNYSIYGAAIVIIDNINLAWTFKEYFGNLAEFSFEGPMKRQNFIVVENNKGGVSEEDYLHFVNLTGNAKMINVDRASCTFSEIIHGARCRTVEDNVMINRSNYFNINLLNRLNKVEVIAGRLVIKDTRLFSINFLSNVKEIAYRTDKEYTLEIINNRNAEFMEIPKLNTIESLCKRYTHMKNNGNLLYNFTKMHPDLIKVHPKSSDEFDYQCPDEDSKLEMLDESICVSNGDFNLTSENMHVLDACRFFECRNLTINENSENIDWHVFSGIHTLRGCLTIMNTTLQSLNFTAQLQTIRNCDRKTIILVENNPFLERLDMGFLYCPDHLNNSFISFVNNEILCLREIQSFEKQVMLKCGIKVNKYGKIPTECPFDRRIRALDFDSSYYIYASIVSILLCALMIPTITFLVKNGYIA